MFNALGNSARPLDMDIHLQSYSIPHFPSLMIAMSKPAYLAVTEYSPTKPVIVFVPSRKQCDLTATDIELHCLADNDEKRFLNVEESELQRHLDHVTDQALVEHLKNGIGIYHEALNKQDKRIVERLFTAGAIQIIVASRVSDFLSFFVHKPILSSAGCRMEHSRCQLHGGNHGRAIFRGQGAPICGLSGDGRTSNVGESLSS
jgi:hypothetical protein